MTAHKHFKHLVRTRMSKTGESYTSARRQMLDDAPAAKPTGPATHHLPGTIPATTALRVLLTSAGVVNPTTNKPFTEAMLFGIAGGIGIGVCQFFYEKEDFASFFVAGRHLWHDDLMYLSSALERFDIEPVVKESSGAKPAEKNLRDALASGRPCIAWVDMSHLPHRAMPSHYSGGGYHVVTVYSIDDAKKTALIGDLSRNPIEVSLEDLATARGRIKKFKNRVLSFDDTASRTLDLKKLVNDGIRACHTGLGSKPMKGWPTTFNLDSVKLWGERLFESKHKDSWDRIFTPGRKLWTGLASIYEFIEHYHTGGGHTGGGLCRPMFARFLSEAGHDELSKRYASLGKQWTELAQAALPVDVPMFKKARDAYAARSSARASASRDDVARAWDDLSALAKQAADKFPLSASDCNALRKSLQARVQEIHREELAARDALAGAG